MGYKLAGCEVIGCCEIDKKMNEVYIKNHKPKYNYLMDIREFNKLDDLPKELYHLDILDGSPPCTTFSMAGDREDSWGVKKKFREGQAEQTLDDLSFVFIETANKLKPKAVIMENVEGLLLGNAWAYVQKIYKEFDNAGYDVKHYLCKGENMGIPQKRHRVFVIAVRKDIDFDFDNLDMWFDYEPITYGEIKEGNINIFQTGSKYYELCSQIILGDKSLADVAERNTGIRSYFNDVIAWENEICPTIRTKAPIDAMDKGFISKDTIRNAQTFPVDYDFNDLNVCYICGMSVPPVMIKRIVERMIKTGVFDEK